SAGWLRCGTYGINLRTGWPTGRNDFLAKVASANYRRFAGSAVQPGKGVAVFLDLVCVHPDGLQHLLPIQTSRVCIEERAEELLRHIGTSRIAMVFCSPSGKY